MSLRLFLLRHAETDWNRERRYQGWQDIPLCEAGRIQAEAAARRLSGSRLAAVWSSPQQRARDTAAAIASPHGLEVHTHEAFKEMGFGPWEGLTVDEARARFPDSYQAWTEAPHVATWPGAESLAQVRGRVLDHRAQGSADAAAHGRQDLPARRGGAEARRRGAAVRRLPEVGVPRDRDVRLRIFRRALAGDGCGAAGADVQARGPRERPLARAPRGRDAADRASKRPLSRSTSLNIRS